MADNIRQEVLTYLKNLPWYQGSQSYNLYAAPTSNIYDDPSSSSLGYQPLKNKDIYINRNKVRDQIDLLDTLFHEAAHTEQPRLYSMFNFLSPTYRKLNNIDFSGYYNEKKAPGAEEVLATLRANDALSRRNETGYDSPMGKDVLTQLRQQNPTMSEQAIRLMLDKAMFPTQNFAYPSNEKTTSPGWLQKLFNLW